jgi:hypothetical protein
MGADNGTTRKWEIFAKFWVNNFKGRGYVSDLG